MRNTYPRLRFGLLVGIGGGVPTSTKEGPIRLGHVVVSEPVGQHSGAVQYDHGKAEASEFVRTGFLAPPPTLLLNAARELQVRRRRLSNDPLVSHLKRIDTSKPGLRSYKQPPFEQDQLYESDYVHLNKDKSCKRCGCDASKLVDRNAEDSDDDSTNLANNGWLIVHRGTIASGEMVMRNGLQRDTLARTHKILCFEMEAAGALNDFPCLVIRGISDYSDSHKNDKWHGYAAAVAAAYARELFRHMPVEEVNQCKIAETDVERMIQSLQECEDYILASLVKDWLRPSDASINLVNASKLRYSDTGRWFLESDRYKWLKTTSGARLWLHGIPGCGKTVLSSTIIEDLRVRSSATKTAVIYFFFSSSEESKQKLDHVLRSLIFQLVGWAESINVHLLKLFKSSPKRIEQPQTTQLVEVFNQMVSELGDVIVVLDALDESEERHDLLRWITSPSNQKFRFILTSRWEIDIEKALAPWLSPNRTINLESDLVGDDIEAYVHYRLKEEERLSRWTLMHEEIMGTLVDKAAGMFRWVYCQLQALSECLDKPAVRRMLQTLPNDLNETYDRILQKIPMPRVPNAIKLLQLLVFSKRSLRLEEVIDAVATEPDTDPPFDAEDRITPPDAIMGYCSHLVRITIVQRDEFAYSEDPNIEGGKLGTALAAASYKGSMKLVQTLLDHGADVNSKGGWYGNALQSSCYSRSYALDPGLIQLLLDKGARINAQGGDYGTALCAASSKGQLEIVELLLREGADVNAPGGKFDYALCAAAHKGHIDVVRALLENGAVAGTPTNPYDFALQVAIEQGNKDIAKLLFEEGALEELTIDRANSHPGLKRSASTSSMWWSAEESSRGSRDAITQAWGIRRHSFDLLDDAAYPQYSD
ncbi:ankyrin repeat protein, partial [Aureobasidium melanogenum]